MLESYCQKAQLQDGQDVLDLGCGEPSTFINLPLILLTFSTVGWGSLSLYLAQVRAYPETLTPKCSPLQQKYPKSRIIGLSNSSTQKAHIDATARSLGLTNLDIITTDVNTHDFQETTRCVSYTHRLRISLRFRQVRPDTFY